MKVVIQRVKKAQVVIDEELVGDIKQGLLLLVGVGPDDEQEDLDYAVRKITNMRIFQMIWENEFICSRCQGKHFIGVTVYLVCGYEKGNRPAFTGAAKPDKAEQLYNAFNEALAQYVPVETGVFGADMYVSLVNDGPVTIILDTKAR